MEKIGSFAYTREVLEKVHHDIQQEIRHLGGNPTLEALIEKLNSTAPQKTATLSVNL